MTETPEATPGPAAPAGPPTPPPARGQPTSDAPSWPAPAPGSAAPDAGLPPAAPQFPPAPGDVAVPQPAVLGPGSCQNCGSTPAIEITSRGHRGMIVLMQFLHRKGTFCRDCGTAITRHMSTRTLLVGWWGIASVFITPVVLLINAVTLRKLGRLGQPQPPEGVVAPPPLDPGSSLWRRPAIAGLLVPVAALGIGIASLPSTPDDTEYAADARPDKGEGVRKVPGATVGDCWVESGTGSYRKVSCTETHKLQIYFVGTAKKFSAYRDAGEKLVSASAQANQMCEPAIDVTKWSITAANPKFGDIYPQEETLNDDSSSEHDLRIICFIDSASVDAATSSVIEGH